MKRSFSYIFVTIPLGFGGKRRKSEHPIQISTIPAKSTKIWESVDMSWITLPLILAPNSCASGKHARDPNSINLLWIASLLQSRERVDSGTCHLRKPTHSSSSSSNASSSSSSVSFSWHCVVVSGAPHASTRDSAVVHHSWLKAGGDGWKTHEMGDRCIFDFIGDVFTFASGLRWWTAAERYSWPCWSTQPELRFNMLMSLEHLTPEVVKIMKTKISCRQDYYHHDTTWQATNF